MEKIGKLSVLFCLLVFGLWSRAEGVQVLATVDRNAVGVGDTFQFKITVSSDSSVNVEPPRPLNVSGLELLNSWTSQQTQSIMAGGKFQVVHAKEFNFSMAASRQGKITIPSVSVIVDGKTYSTDPITMEVGGKSQGGGAQGSNDPFGDQMDQLDQMDRMEQQMFNQLLQRRFGGNPPSLPDQEPGQGVNPKEAFFIRAETDKKTAYVGEQVTAKWYLYTRGQITDIDTLKYPDLKGFWKEELEMATRLDFEQVVINGIPYQRALLVSYALFPIKAGAATVDSYKAKCTVITPGNFGFGRPYQFTKGNPPIKITVVDVPKDNRPSDFTGAVGAFHVKASLDRTTVPAHQPVTWKIHIEGRGNAKLIDLPKLDLPTGVELYDQKADAKFNKNGTSFKDFEVLLIPRETGEVEIPAIKLSVFNPEKKVFERIESQPLKLTVTPGQRTDQPLVQSGSGEPSAPTKQAVKSAEYPFFSTPGTEQSETPEVPSSLWWILFSSSGLSVLAHGFLVLGKTKRKETLKQILNLRMKDVKKKLAHNDWRGFGRALSNSTYKILGLVVGSQAGSKELESLLQAAPPSLRRELGEPLRRFVREVEALAFAPEEIAKNSAERSNLLRLQDEFEKLMKAAIQKVEEN